MYLWQLPLFFSLEPTSTSGLFLIKERKCRKIGGNNNVSCEYLIYRGGVFEGTYTHTHMAEGRIEEILSLKSIYCGEGECWCLVFQQKNVVLAF